MTLLYRMYEGLEHLNTKLGFRICWLLIKTFIEFKAYMMIYTKPIPQDMKDRFKK